MLSRLRNKGFVIIKNINPLTYSEKQAKPMTMINKQISNNGISSRAGIGVGVKKILFLASFLFIGASLSSKASAATLDLIGDKSSYPIGQEFTLDIKINSEGEGVNGAQAILQFDKSILEAIKADKTGSIFDFWLTEPTISNAEGRVSFIAASTTGYTGQSLQVLRVTFRPKGAAKSTLVFSDAAITAADGSGKNVLTKTNGLTITLAGASGVTEPPPIQITRPPTPPDGSPKIPVITVPLYPDPTKWNNVSAKFFANWQLPTDITGVAAVLNKTIGLAPTVSEGLFESKSFPPLEDGVYYLHVRFRNVIGWGPTLHYKIAIDSTPPTLTKIALTEGTPTGEPAPTLTYQSTDSLSGIGHYEIRIDNQESIKVSTRTFKLLNQAPGEHSLTVKAIDAAGNSAESKFSFEILPIESPVITAVSSDIFIGEGALAISGKSISGYRINIALKDNSGRTVFTSVQETNEDGNWSLSLYLPLKKGVYFAEVVAEDDRGALSLPVKSSSINVHERPLFTLGGLEITKSALIFILVFLMISGLAGAFAYYRARQLNIERRIVIAQRDVITMTNLIRQDLDKVSKLLSENESNELAGVHEPIQLLISKIRGSADKMTKYVVDNIGEIRD